MKLSRSYCMDSLFHGYKSYYFDVAHNMELNILEGDRIQ